MKARLGILATICVVIGFSACSDPNSLQATLPTSVDTLSVWALSGTPPSYPSGISIVARQAVPIDAFGQFDVALDINENGQPVIYPVKLVVTQVGGTREVGMQTVTGDFDSLMVAPKSGFEADSGLVLTPGQVVMLQSTHAGQGDFCQFAISPDIYAKITVDSLNLASRILYFRMGVDPNCGFRSFAGGLPAD
ncbi:MAG: hypothetical protein ACREMS_01900 [Gemmatimonadaceae bacterium]